jgi:glyceraldehyde-3-phosphate dehydrogenase/erythrose-4-phosphate dehydrogenase
LTKAELGKLLGFWYAAGGGRRRAPGRPAGSLADIVFLTAWPTTEEEINNIFREEAAGPRYRGVLGVAEDQIVSSDVIQDPRAFIIDLSMTKVVDNDLVKVMSWYDNEWGYTNQMIREAGQIAKECLGWSRFRVDFWVLGNQESRLRR